MSGAETALDLLQGLAVLIVTGVVASRAARLLRLPDIILLLLAGALVGPVGLHLLSTPTSSVMSQLILTSGVAFILFEGGLELSFRALRPTLITILVLATLGVLASAALTGMAAGLIWSLPPLLALLLGAVIVPTDPAVLIPLFKQISVRDKCQRTLIAESAFNDATGSILALSLAAALSHGGELAPMQMLLEMLREAAIGVIIGLGLGYLLKLLVLKDAFRLRLLGSWLHLSPQLMLLGAISAYTLATRAHGNGFMAAFIAGLALEGLEDDSTHHFVENLSALFRMMIFVSLGSNIDFAAIGANLGWSCVIVLIFALIVRPLVIWPSAWLDRRAEWSWRELLFLSWARPTGVMPAALLGLLAAYHLPGYDKIYAVTFLTILVTILGQAATAGWLAQKLALVDTPTIGLARVNLLDALLVDPRYSIIQVAAPAELIGKTLQAADLRARYGIYVLVVKHGDTVDIVPDPQRVIAADDQLVLLGKSSQLEQILSQHIG